MLFYNNNRIISSRQRINIEKKRKERARHFIQEGEILTVAEVT